ncbi:hypothetical protein ENBRE01_2930 [Enteropsectra breve]|nr:hypothetical protein ENBRE01_2930 [Enteropsectra breve]
MMPGNTNAAHIGKPSIVTKNISSKIDQLANQERAVSAHENRDEVHSSGEAYLGLQSIRNVLKEKGFISSSRPRKPRLTKLHRLQRHAFSKKHAEKQMEDWQIVVFTDETKFNLFGPDGPQRVWRLPGKPSLSHQFRQVVKFSGGSVMAWGAITYWGVVLY